MGIIAPMIFEIDLSHSSAISSGQKLILLVVGTVLTTIIIFLFRIFVDRKTISSLGLIGKRRDKMLLAGFGFGALTQIIVFLILFLIGEYKLTSVSYPSSAVVFPFLIALNVAWQEELFYRAYVIDNLKIFSNIFAIVASAAFFVIPHISGRGFDNPAIYISIFMFGMLAGLTYLKSKSIFMPLGFHLGFNSIEDVLLSGEIINGEILCSGLRLELLYWIAFVLIGFWLMKFLDQSKSRNDFAAKEQNP